MNVFTFWEGEKPAYIEMCMETWKVPCIVLNYDNLNDYTDLDVEALKRFSLPQIADCVRVHVLRDHGGYWLDADTIMLTDRLPTTNMVGDPKERTNAIGYLYAEPHSDMYEAWSKYQDAVIADPNASHHWSIMGNAFTDPYVRDHMEISIAPISDCWPETYMIDGNIPRYYKYISFYFDSAYDLSDLQRTKQYAMPDMLMLHNSWTPRWYKDLSREKVLSHHCTLSRILKEVTCRLRLNT